MDDFGLPPIFRKPPSSHRSHPHPWRLHLPHSFAPQEARRGLGLREAPSAEGLGQDGKVLGPPETGRKMYGKHEKYGKHRAKYGKKTRENRENRRKNVTKNTVNLNES